MKRLDPNVSFAQAFQVRCKSLLCPLRKGYRGINPYGLSYDAGMANVVTTGEARDALHKIAQRFDAGEGEPVYFGSHRRAQGVIVPVAVWETLLDAAEDELDAELARDRITRDDGRQLSRAEVNDVFDRLRAGRSA